jgi:ABC-type sugar transport system permease subunit
MWSFLFQYTGVINYMLMELHIGAVNWSTTETGIASIIVVVVWENVPFSMIVFLAGLQSIDPELEAAARVDGATGLQRFRSITLPLMRPFVLIVLAIRTMDLLRLFDEAYILTGGAPARTTETLSELVYTETFTYFNIGDGAALAIMEGLVIMGAIAFIFATLRVDHESRGG